MKQFESRESYILKFPAHHPAVKKLTKKEYIKEQKRIAARTLEEIEADRRLAFEKVTQARKEYLLRFPFMGFIICKMQMVWLDKVRTMGVSIRECNIYCYYCAPWVNTLTVEETMGVLEHEALHVLDLHMSRMASREPTAWNIACDMAINWLIKLKLPKEGTFAPKKLEGKAAEYIYDALQQQGQGGGGEEEEEEKKKGPQGQEGTGGTPGGDEEGEGPGGDGEDEGGSGGEGEGYGEMDNHDVWKNSDHAGLAEVVVKQMVREALARNKGTCPGEYQTLIDKILKTKCNWRALLRYYVTSRVRANRKISYKHRNRRRMTVSKYIFPGHVRKEGLDVIVVCDTSGSMMNEKDMEQFFGELEGIIRQTSAKTRLIQIDAAVHSDLEYKKGDWRKVKLVGGGGTDFRPVFKHIEEKGYKPCIVVFYTDGQGDYPEGKDIPDYTVLWAMVTDYQAPFGKIVKLDLD
jgi:predicted metal-dependent peptidase